jgi:hypothetical protein
MSQSSFTFTIVGPSVRKPVNGSETFRYGPKTLVANATLIFRCGRVLSQMIAVVAVSEMQAVRRRLAEGGEQVSLFLAGSKKYGCDQEQQADSLHFWS